MRWSQLGQRVGQGREKGSEQRSSASAQAPRVSPPSATTPGGSSLKTSVHHRGIGESGLSTLPVALGTSVFGWTVDRGTSMRIMDRFHSLGGTFLDTADNYAAGQSELMIGNWMRTRGTRDDMIVATKVGRGTDFPGLSPDNIRGAVEASLERLQTDRIDVLYFHIDDENTPLEKSLTAAQSLIQAGKVRALGASNLSAHRLMEARVMTAYGLPRFESIQEHYNLMHRAAYEGDVGLVAEAQGLGVLPHYALAHGFLAGEYRRRADGIGNARRARAGQYLNRRGMRVLSVLDRVAVQQGISVAQVALAWLQSRPGVVAPVVSADTEAHVDDMMASPEVLLTGQQLTDLDRVSTVTRVSAREVRPAH